MNVEFDGFIAERNSDEFYAEYDAYIAQQELAEELEKNFDAANRELQEVAVEAQTVSFWDGGRFLT